MIDYALVHWIPSYWKCAFSAYLNVVA